MTPSECAIHALAATFTLYNQQLGQARETANVLKHIMQAKTPTRAAGGLSLPSASWSTALGLLAGQTAETAKAMRDQLDSAKLRAGPMAGQTERAFEKHAREAKETAEEIQKLFMSLSGGST